MSKLSTSSAPNYMTPQGFRSLQEEFQQLFHGERPKLVETIAWAASNGDRSENADYIYGKRRLREIDKRLLWLKDRIESARVIDPTSVQSDTVVFGATVTLLTEDDEVRRYQIVGETEGDVEAGKISWKSPVARALLGKRVGDEAEIHRPVGRLIVEISKIEFV